MYEGCEELELRPMMGEVGWTDTQLKNVRRVIQIGVFVVHTTDDGECRPVKPDEGCDQTWVCSICGKRFCIGG